MFTVKHWKKMRNKKREHDSQNKKGYGNQNTLKAKAGEGQEVKNDIVESNAKKKCILFRDGKISLIITL